MTRDRPRGGFDPLGVDREPEMIVRGSGPTPLGEVLGTVSARRGWARRLEGAKVHEVWSEVVGPELAQHVQPVRLHGGVLVVRTSSSAWATQVRYLAGTLTAQLNARLGEGLVERVTVTTGTRSDRSGQSPRSGG